MQIDRKMKKLISENDVNEMIRLEEKWVDWMDWKTWIEVDTNEWIEWIGMNWLNDCGIDMNECGRF